VRIAAWLDLAVQVAGLAADAKDMLELVVVWFDLVPGDAPVQRMAVLGNERCAIKRSLMRECISKSCGRKRRALPPQCVAVPPTISPGLNAPISRIGSAVCASLLRNVMVSRGLSP